jgi:uncharacterized protein (TIGR00255 family)
MKSDPPQSGARNGKPMELMSMTGRGTGAAAGRLVRVEVELSSVNRKQLDVVVGLPRGLAAFESRVQAQIQGALARGRVSGEIRVTWTAAALARSARIDEARAQALVGALRAAARRLGLPDDLKASALLALPEVLVAGCEARDAEAAWPVVARALAKALESLRAMRRREGAALGRDLRARLRKLQGLTGAIARRAPAVAGAYRRQLLKRLGAALPGADLAADERVLKELALFADRADIAEELVRLRSHLDQAGRLLRQGGVAGRALDFLVQELGREINTIGAKANDAVLTRQVLAFKVELERIREQVQNIE